MSLSLRLTEFTFDLDTVHMLSSLGRSNDEISTELSALGFNNQLIDLVLNNERLFTRAMLRLRVYSEQNASETTIRNGFSLLNSSLVNNLLDYLFNSQVVQTTPEPVVATPVKPTRSKAKREPTPEPEEVVEEAAVSDVEASDVENVEDSDVEVSDDEEEDTEARFNNFFNDCINQEAEATDILKASDAYNAFTEWWNEANYGENIPDKKELKNFLTERLGKSKKSTWTNVCLA